MPVSAEQLDELLTRRRLGLGLSLPERRTLELVDDLLRAALWLALLQRIGFRFSTLLALAGAVDDQAHELEAPA